MGEETNLAHMFQKKLYIGNRMVKDVFENPKLLKTAEEREAFRDIQFYEKAVEVQLDLIKCYQNDIEFIKALTRAQDNCSMAYQKAHDKLHILLIEGDEREAKQRSTARYVQATRHKTVERRRNNSMSTIHGNISTRR